MMRELHITKSFKTDMKKLNNKERNDTREVVLKLQKDEPLEEKYSDHALHGNYEGFRECHVHPDLLLVYEKTDDDNIYILSLLRINSHTNIFDTNKR
ncbi:type II toxin-antitoxin system YafQ family toxin [bacterium]|nr:type II toxin-antitoxin system YafQ family toxin [bacterium]